jgi:hypothetical protein
LQNSIFHSVFPSLAGLRVNAAVQLNGEAALGTIKIDDITPDRMLPPKLEAKKSPAPQEPPRRFFGVRHPLT